MMLILFPIKIIDTIIFHTYTFKTHIDKHFQVLKKNVLFYLPISYINSIKTFSV